MKLAVITSGGANFFSIEMVLQRLGVDYKLTNQKSDIDNADAVILPGVGAAEFAMNRLHEDGLVDVIQNCKKPLLGICLGMQLLYDNSEEGNVDCLGIISGNVKKFDESKLIVPHMGWNNLQAKQSSVLLDSIDINRDVYFVHSFFAPVNEHTVASTNYGDEFTAICHKDNFYGMQFHPEKSGDIGEKLIANFIKLIK